MARARARPVVQRATKWVKANPLVSKSVPTAIGNRIVRCMSTVHVELR